MESCQGQTGVKANFREGNSTSIECFHSRDQWACFSTKGKENVSIRIKFNSHRTRWWHQHDRRSFVWGHQHDRRDVTWNYSIRLLKFFDTIFNKDHAYTTPGATYHFLKTGLSSCVGLEVKMNISGGRNCSTSGRFSLRDLSCENWAIIPRARVAYCNVHVTCYVTLRSHA